MEDLVKIEHILIKDHPGLNESWIEEQIAKDPAMLGLGDLVLKDRQKVQPKAGRLDLLLQDADSSCRYEVEIQLGTVDESHIIRTIEYWDIERKRYPQYDHTAVIVAEDITSRFLNVISLFNGTIPIIAIQMNALHVDGKIGLVFVTVLDQMTLGLEDEDEEPTNRKYWETQGTSETVRIADKLLEMVKQHDDDLKLKYNKFYIGLAKDGVPNNFLVFRPKKKITHFEPKLKHSPKLEEQLEQAGLGFEYRARGGRYRLRLRPADLEENSEILAKLVQEAWDNNK